jgi:predicted HicB family RNase H-like nuclease
MKRSNPSKVAKSVLDIKERVDEANREDKLVEAEQIRKQNRKAERRFTLYIPEEVHDGLRQIAFDQRTSIHALITECLDRWLATKNAPTFAGTKAKARAEKAEK